MIGYSFVTLSAPSLGVIIGGRITDYLVFYIYYYGDIREDIKDNR